MRLDYTQRSLRHLQAIYDYIAQADPRAAERTVNRIHAAIQRLAVLPFSGRPGRVGSRILAVPGLPYVVAHRIRPDRVQILAIFHTARNRQF
jgi:toxin ParE1/3/4